MMVDATILNVIRLITGTIVLTYACYTDIKTRRAADILWVIMGIVGIILLIIQYLDGEFSNIWYIIFIPIMIALAYIINQLPLSFGGADTKALMALAILVPILPLIGAFPLWPSYLPGSFCIFLNALLISLFHPVTLLFYNIRKRNLRFPHCLLGYVISLEKAKQTFVWPMERIKNGKLKLVYLRNNFDVEEELTTFEKLGIKEIWVTPKIPFMVSLLAGFLATFVLGDIFQRIFQMFI
jgi:preflagellin peptidase FlaK